jgi:hypothetical protein
MHRQECICLQCSCRRPLERETAPLSTPRADDPRRAGPGMQCRNGCGCETCGPRWGAPMEIFRSAGKSAEALSVVTIGSTETAPSQRAKMGRACHRPPFLTRNRIPADGHGHGHRDFHVRPAADPTGRAELADPSPIRARIRRLGSGDSDQETRIRRLRRLGSGDSDQETKETRIRRLGSED